MKEELLQGRIARIVADKGFGFISANDVDFFFHHTGCVDNFDDFKTGQLVTFEYEQSQKGPRANNIRLVKNEK